MTHRLRRFACLVSSGVFVACSSGHATSGTPSAPANDERSSLARDANPDATDAELTAVVSAQNQLGLSLLTSVAAPSDNFVFSPTSATIALSMLYAGARGATATQMQAVLGDSLPSGRYHVAWNRLLLTLASRNIAPYTSAGVEHHLQLNAADHLWTQQGLPIVAAFLDTLAQQYGSGVAVGDFAGDADGVRQSINGWVAQQTNDRIQTLFGPGSINSTARLVLVNALYFNGTWLGAFPESATAPAPFHLATGSDVSVSMMNSEPADVPYKSNADYEVVDLPYEGGALSLSIVLPQVGHYDAVRALLGQSGGWSDLFSALTRTHLALALPKLTYQGSSFSIRAGLEALGMTSAFADADFSGMASDAPLALEDVVQQDYLAIDENGTEAAAATGAVVGINAVESVLNVTIDRPYFLFVRDASGLVLFTAQINDPSR
jgi:serpin B